MARLIIGHVACDLVKIWVRGERSYPWANVAVRAGDALIGTAQIGLEERHGFTGCVTIKGLQPDTGYSCQVTYAKDRKAPIALQVDFGNCHGRFVTPPLAEAPAGFSFMLGSCNLHSLGPFNSPDDAFEALIEKSEAASPRFMIHCGDQIYYDIPNPLKQPGLEEYRQKYLDAWQDCRPARAFLTRMPHYMIMDDHEITNDFSNDFDPPGTATPAQFMALAMKAYREFVHIRMPDTGDQAYYYSFSHGDAQFFVMDTRTERWSFQKDPKANQIIGQEQMSQLKRWLAKYKDKPKFVVSSVPFVATVRRSDDKWGAPAFAHQRDEVIDFLAEKGIGQLVFLTGDMHNSYHATLEITGPAGVVIVHELMSSPINQLEKSSYDKYEARVAARTARGTVHESRLLKSEFYNAHSNAMLITVGGGRVDWEVFRTKKSRVDLRGSFAL